MVDTERPVESVTVLERSGALTMRLITTVRDADGPLLELSSLYIGESNGALCSNHRVRTPDGGRAVDAVTHATDERLGPAVLSGVRARQLGYDHAHRLLVALQGRGRRVGIEIDERALELLDRTLPAAPDPG